MNIAQIEDNLQKLIKSFSKETFIYDLLLSYGLPKASITRLKMGSKNLSKTAGEISWKKKLFFKVVENGDLHVIIDGLKQDPKVTKHTPRFIVVTDYDILLAIDTKTEDTLDVEIKSLPKRYDFFLPWAGMEKAQHKDENPADVKAAERMAKLFDEIKKDNPDNSPEFVHSLNVFLSRLLFCFFAEDTNIFHENQFTTAIDSHTQSDGGDLNTYLDKLFEVLNTPEDKRHKLPEYLTAFPYVNGGLFRHQYHAPIFTNRSRKAIIESGQLNWSAINPDIFGSMIQAVVTPEHRGGLGMHYTSVPNIMKVIEPLFLNGLYEEFEKAKGSPKKLDQLLGRIQRIKIFDPACGSGNFLIIAYKELRKLEMKILKASKEFISSGISLSQFYGIEIDDFAHEVAMLSLWLAEHQMNIEFFKEFGQTNPTLPLKDAGHIVCGNATRMNWEAVCPKNDGDEIYILGNPPYLGSRLQNKEQKQDVVTAFTGIKNCRDLDYVSCWFYKGAKYISNSQALCSLAFVTTSSLCQGSQVAGFWPFVFDMGLEIHFAHKPFKWTNNAKDKAAVICAIIGLRKISNSPKYLYSSHTCQLVDNINAYLLPLNNVIISKKLFPLSNIPIMLAGNYTGHAQSLTLTTSEKNKLLVDYPNAQKIIKKLIGSIEFINGIERWCLWIKDTDIKLAESIPPVRKRISEVKNSRLKSTDISANKLAVRPHQFRDLNETNKQSLIIPIVSSERRDYIPIGFICNDTIVTNKAMVVYDSEPYVFGIVSSLMHMVWVRAVSGRLKSDPSYSSVLCYNTFPFPNISDTRKETIANYVFQVLNEREKYPEKTLAQLYDPNKMPKCLREAHHQLDLAVELCYRSKPFENDQERLEYLFNLYEKMIEEEKEKNTLFAAKKNSQKRRRI